jgi:hypothetical protein
VKQLVREGDWVRVIAVTGLGPGQQASRRYAGQLGRVTEMPTDPGGYYAVMLDDGPQLQLPDAAFVWVPIDEYGDPIEGPGSAE